MLSDKLPPMNPPLCACRLSENEILSYRRYGTGPTRLVLLHGLASRSEEWTDLVPLFPPDRYTIYALDLLGSGASSKPAKADYSIRAHALRLLRFLEMESLSGVVLVGHSLGGAVVLLAAIEAMLSAKEALVESLVIIAGPGYPQRLPIIAEIFRYRFAAQLFVTLYAPDLWVKVGLKMAYYDARLVDREHIARYAPCYRNRAARRALVETCLRLVPPDQEEIAALYRELRLPILLLWGRHDRIVPLWQGSRLEASIPGARLEVMEECGHNPQEEKPQETFRLIESFVRRDHSAP